MDKVTKSALLGALAGAVLAEDGKRTRGALVGGSIGVGLAYGHEQLKSVGGVPSLLNVATPNSRVFSQQNPETLLAHLHKMLGPAGMEQLSRTLKDRKNTSGDAYLTADEARALGIIE